MNPIRVLLGFGTAVSLFLVVVGIHVIYKYSFDWTPPAFALSFIPLFAMMVIATWRQPRIKNVELLLLPIALSTITLLFGGLTHEEDWKAPWCISHLIITGTTIALWLSSATLTGHVSRDN